MISLRSVSIPALAALLLSACPATQSTSVEPPVPSAPGFRLERMFAVAADGGVLFGGLDGAASPGVVVSISGTGSGQDGTSTADEHGRFAIPLSGAAGDTLDVVIDGAAPVSFRVRDPARARMDAVRAPIDGAGSVPNDFVVGGSADAPLAIVVRSGDNAISLFDLERGIEDGAPAVRLPTTDICGLSSPANPWFVAPLDGARAAVTAFGQPRVYIVDLNAGQVETILEIDGALPLDAPFELAFPVDVDCDGVDDTRVTRVTPRAPQGLAVVGRSLVVAYSGFVSPRLGTDRPPVYVPAVLATWSLDNLQAAPRTRVLPALNPNEVRAIDDQRALVTLTGPIDYITGGPTVSSPGAVVIVDVASMSIEREFDVGDLVAGTAVTESGALWVGSIAKGEVLRIDLDSGERQTIRLNNEPVDSIFRLVTLPGGLIAAPSFNTDRLHIIDTRTGALDPAPFFAPLDIGPGPPVFDGLQAVAARPGRPGVDFVGPDLFCLAGIASRVTPVETRKLFGP